MRIRFFLVVPIILLLGIVGCSKSEQASSIYKIGAVLPLTGPIGYLGEQELIGLKLAVEDINARAKVNGFTVSLRFEDFASQPTNAVTAAQKLIEIDGVDALFVSTTSATRAVASIAQARSIPMLVLSSDPEITKAAPVVFRVFMNSGIEQSLLADRIVRLGIKSVYVLYNRDRAFESAFGELRDILVKKGFSDVRSDTFEKIQTDFRILIEKAKRANADGYVFLGFGSEFPLILSQWGERRKGRYFGNYTFGTAGAHGQGITLVEGIEFPTFAIRNDSPELSDFVRRALLLREGKPLSDFMDHLYSYESLLFLEQCIRNAKLGGRDLLSGCVAIKEFKGLSGSIDIAESRDAKIPMRMGVYREGMLRNVE